LAAIYEECALLYRSFTKIVFFHIPRETNTASYTLARHAKGSMSIVWHDDPPDFIASVLAHDVRGDFPSKQKKKSIVSGFV
jgi:hypothetical protein